MKIILKDGSYLYSYDTASEWLLEHGFDREDIETLQELLVDEYRGGCLTYKELEDLCDERERIMDDYYCSLRDLAEEVSELCGKLAAGKGGTKAQMAEKIMNAVEFYRP